MKSRSTQTIHKKWQDAAISMGGPNAKVILLKPKAKAMIFEVLHNYYKPMNLVQIYNVLKAIVPSPFLKACIDEMVKKKYLQNADNANVMSVEKATIKYENSLVEKCGRNKSDTVYYVNAFNLENGGNGISLDLRQQFYELYQAGKIRVQECTRELIKITRDLKFVKCQLTSNQIEQKIQWLNAEISRLEHKVFEAKRYEHLWKLRIQLLTSVQDMIAIWYERKKNCMDFLSYMDECSEGEISVKKSVKGQGPIKGIESDEAVSLSFMTMQPYEKKRKNASVDEEFKARSKKSKITPSFVALKLINKTNVERIKSSHVN